MSGSLIEFPTASGAARGHLTMPPAGTGPGLIVLQEWWGLVGHITAVAERFAAEGYVTLAPDLYRGASATSPDEAQRLMMALDMPFTANALRGAAEFLLAHEAVTPKKVGVLGFCMGGQLALYAATAHPDVIASVVDFYGVFNPRVPVDLSALRAPVMAHFGEHDKAIPREQAESLMRDVAAAGVESQVYFYDAGHAFFNDARPAVYNPGAAELAWQRTTEFLARTLG